MGVHKAVVQRGRLVLDEPTDYPEGTVIELEEVDPYAHLEHDDELDEEEIEQRHASIRRGYEQAQAGLGRPIEDVISELRQRG